MAMAVWSHQSPQKLDEVRKQARVYTLPLRRPRPAREPRTSAQFDPMPVAVCWDAVRRHANPGC